MVLSSSSICLTQAMMTFPKNNYSLALLDKTTTQLPIKAINTNDALKVASPAIKPIMGGPNKNPINPMVDTAAKATPGCMVFDRPAALYTIGTTDDTPAPTNKNPAIAV